MRCVRLLCLFTSMMVAAGGCALAAADPAPAASPSARELTIDQVLDALDKTGQDLKAFDAKVTLIERDETTQLESKRAGVVRFQRKSTDDARIRVIFDKRFAGKDTTVNEKIEYVLDNGWLTDRDYQKRIEVRRQVLRPGEKMNLLKLGEGPFPMPIGQKKDDVKKLFKVTKEKPSKDDPKDVPTVHVVLTPLPGTAFAKKFSAIEVWMDVKTNFPARIDTTDMKGQSTKSTSLMEVRVNPNMTDADFVPEKISPEKWNIHEEPFKQ